jgi:uncharacterized protein YcfL
MLISFKDYNEYMEGTYMIRLLTIMLALVLISGCGAKQVSQPVEGKLGNEKQKQVEEKVIKTNLETSLQVRQESDKLVFDISLMNKGNDMVELTFSSGQKYEIVVTNDQGEEVYRFSEGKMFTQALQLIELKAGDQVNWTEEWNMTAEGQGIANGAYTVEAEVLIQEDDKLSIEPKQLTAQEKVNIELSSTANELENKAFRNIKVEGSKGSYVVTGEARVFEATFHYAVTEGHKYYIEGWATVAEGGPSWSPFTLELKIPEDQLPVNGSVILELYEESADDGSAVNQLFVPLDKIG